jgi:hypothetical protein
MSWYDRLIDADLRLSYRVNVWLGEHRLLHKAVSRLTSSNPLHDASLLTTVVFIIATFNCSKYYYRLLYISSVNLFVSTCLRALLKAKRPFEYDSRLRPLADKYRTSYGFPSLESVMSVVVNGYCCIESSFAFYVSLPLFCLTMFIALTRIHAKSRFIHQIVLSWFVGMLGLWGAYWLLRRWEGWHLHYRVHIGWAIIVMIILLSFVGLAIEDNSSNFGSIPREEYVRVVGGLFNTDPTRIAEHVARQNLGNSGGGGNNNDRSKNRRLWKLQNRKDSSYYLQNSLMRKDYEKKYMAQQVRQQQIEQQQRQMQYNNEYSTSASSRHQCENSNDSFSSNNSNNNNTTNYNSGGGEDAGNTDFLSKFQ